MVDVRCKDFDDVIWAYVAENAKHRDITRCKALEEIVKEHMKFLAEIQRKKTEGV